MHRLAKTLKLPPDVLKRLQIFEDTVLAPLVVRNDLPVTVAEQLLRVMHVQQRAALANQAVEERWSGPQAQAASGRQVVMTCLTRVCGVATTLLALTFWCTAPAWADERPTTITLQVPSGAAAGITTVTVQVRPMGPQSTEVHIFSDADPRSPTMLKADVAEAGFASAAVDTLHEFNWTVPVEPTAIGCGPQPTAGTPECSQVGGAQIQPEPDATPMPADASPSRPVEVAGQQALPAPTSSASRASSPATQASPAATAPAPGLRQAAASDHVSITLNVVPPDADNTVQPSAPSPVVYTVQPGDTLARIALRFYGDPAAYARIAAANAGQVMLDGQTFDDPGFIRPGWKLVIPEPTQGITDTADGRLYTVQPGDTLVRIAAQLLGDPQRWSEIYSLNTGQVGGGPTLALGPNLIEPGMLLYLPS